MRTANSVDSKIIALAEAVRAEVLFEVGMNVSFSEFYKLSLQKKFQEEQFLNYNLYKYQV